MGHYLYRSAHRKTIGTYRYIYEIDAHILTLHSVILNFHELAGHFSGNQSVTSSGEYVKANDKTGTNADNGTYEENGVKYWYCFFI